MSDVLYWFADLNIYCQAECVYADAHNTYFLVFILSVIVMG